MAEPSVDPEVLALIERGELEALGPEELLRWGMERFGTRIGIAVSFGAPDGLCVLDMMKAIDKNARVFFLDTGRLPQATYDLVHLTGRRHDVAVEFTFPDADEVREMVQEHGPNLFYDSVELRMRCCEVRKTRPMKRKLEEFDAWVTGRRRDQSTTRKNLKKVEVDPANPGKIKLNPIVDWTEQQVWDYVRRHNVQTNRLHAHGYPSVGCDPCSRPIVQGEGPRAGRWWWENPDTRECGIHLGMRVPKKGESS